MTTTSDPIAFPLDVPRPTPVGGLRAQHAIVGDLQRSVRLGPDQLRRRPTAGSGRRPRVSGVRPTALPRVAVPAAVPEPVLTLDEVLARRESVRFHSDVPLDPAVVARVVRAGHAADAAAWPDEVAAGLGIELLVAARRMTGAAPAVYRLAGDAFEPLADLHDEDADDLVLQLEFAASPVILVAIAPFADALERWGDHGERLANTRAAAAVSAALLEAFSLGLDGSPFAGFLTSGLRRLLDVDGYANAQMFAASLGHRAGEDTTDADTTR